LGLCSSNYEFDKLLMEQCKFDTNAVKQLS
jgi:hypothetical protein